MPPQTYEFVKYIGSPGTGAHQYVAAGGIGIHTNGDILVADSLGNRILRYDSAGTYLGSFGTAGTGNGELAVPCDVIVDASGACYVADTGNYRVQKFTSNYAYASQWTVSGIPMFLALSANGQSIYVNSLPMMRQFSSNGVPGPAWNFPLGKIAVPFGFGLNAIGEVMIADGFQVLRYAAGGAYLGRWGEYGSGDGMFQSVSAVCIDASGDVYVADTARLQKFSASGTFLSTWGAEGVDPGQMYGPSHDVAVSASGNVFVLNNNRISEFHRTS